MSGIRTATMIWLFSLLFSDLIFIGWLVSTSLEWLIAVIPFVAISFICGLPAYAIICFAVKRIGKSNKAPGNKLLKLHFSIILIALLYSAPAFLFEGVFSAGLYSALRIAACLCCGGLLSLVLNRRLVHQYLGCEPKSNSFLSTQNIRQMFTDPDHERPLQSTAPAGATNKILTKSIITAALILVMIIPTTFIQNLISERQDRQKEVVNEVSSKWAEPQTVSAPYLVIPYTTGEGGAQKQLIILPGQLNVKGNITEEDRQRSIYKVLLYRTGLNFNGSFNAAPHLPASAVLQLNNAKLCFGLSDFRGIEDKMNITFGNVSYTLLPGLPVTTIDEKGLSVPVTITADDFAHAINFNMDISLRGSGSLHFLPVSSYSNYNITSSWPNPSFDGNTLPVEHSISGNGFEGTWKFIAANLPFTDVIADSNVNTKDIAFGVSLVQPADQYVKSMRSAKYAILIIGLTFVLFFVFELLQKKPVHPVQYALIGMALAIFYTLLISISEIILFEYAYSIAASATILLIGLYAKSHFGNWRSALIIGLLLIGLYGFIYVLISLEDTALLVGSIALFIVVAIIMYVTRKVNWYQSQTHTAINFQP